MRGRARRTGSRSRSRAGTAGENERRKAGCQGGNTKTMLGEGRAHEGSPDQGSAPYIAGRKGTEWQNGTIETPAVLPEGAISRIRDPAATKAIADQ